MVAAQKHPLRQRVHRQLPGEIFIDIGQRGLDLGVKTALRRALRDVETPYQHQKLHDQRLADRFCAGALVRLGFLVIGQHRHDLRALLLVRRQEPLSRAAGRLEAVHQPRLGQQTVKILPVEIEDDALVWLPLVDDRLVDRVLAHQQHRPAFLAAAVKAARQAD